MFFSMGTKLICCLVRLRMATNTYNRNFSRTSCKDNLTTLTSPIAHLRCQKQKSQPLASACFTCWKCLLFSHLRQASPEQARAVYRTNTSHWVTWKTSGKRFWNQSIRLAISSATRGCWGNYISMQILCKWTMMVIVTVMLLLHLMKMKKWLKLKTLKRHLK